MVSMPRGLGKIMVQGNPRIWGYDASRGGGQLSAGPLHAYGQLHEACVQLWGRGGERQVVAVSGKLKMRRSAPTVLPVVRLQAACCLSGADKQGRGGLLSFFLHHQRSL
jgi:hypothetical protein